MCSINVVEDDWCEVCTHLKTAWMSWLGSPEPLSCSYTSQSLDGRSLWVWTAADSRLFTLVAMATITELKCGKRFPSFMNFCLK